MVLSINNPRIVLPEIEEGMFAKEDDDEYNDRYLSFELKDPLRPAMRPVRQNIFYNQNSSFVEEWEALLPEERGGKWEPKNDDDTWNINTVPTILRYIVNCEFYEYPLGTPSYMVYSQSLAGHVEGEVVCSNGKPKSYDHITLVVWPSYRQNPVMDEEGMLKISAKTGLPIMEFAKDEHGNLIQEGYVKGWSPSELGPRMASLYYPLEDLLDNVTSGKHTMPDDAEYEGDDANEGLDEPEEAEETGETRPTPRAGFKKH